MRIVYNETGVEVVIIPSSGKKNSSTGGGCAGYDNEKDSEGKQATTSDSVQIIHILSKQRIAPPRELTWSFSAGATAS
jgi:hypothetical protein